MANFFYDFPECSQKFMRETAWTEFHIFLNLRERRPGGRHLERETAWGRLGGTFLRPLSPPEGVGG